MIGILINEPDGFPKEALERLRMVGALYRADQPYPHESIRAVFIRLRDYLGKKFLDDHPLLRYVVSPTTGLNHIDIDHFAAAGVQIISLKGRVEFLNHIYSTSEYSLALTLALIRHIPAAVRSVSDGHWNRYPFQGTELHGKNVFLIGYGRIGRQVHGLFRAFGSRVLAYDIDTGKVPADIFTSLENGLSCADIVSIHVNLEPSTQSFFTDGLMALMSPKAILINTSRGELVDQPALLRRVANGQLGGAALDVLSFEPMPLNEGVRKYIEACSGRLLVTPHIGGFTSESLYAVENYVTDLFLSKLGVK